MAFGEPAETQITRPSTPDSAVELSPGTSSLTSVASECYNYESSHGRLYHSYHPGTYFGSINEDDQEAGRYLHAAFDIFFGKLFQSPLKSPGRVLDVGTETGKWAVDMADRYPAADVIGIDLAPIAPLWVPTNCQFQVADAAMPWTFKHPFDLVFAREATRSLGKREFFKQCYDHLRPGGWLELQDVDRRCCCNDGSEDPDATLQAWQKSWHTQWRPDELAYYDPAQVKQWMEDAGFENIECSLHWLPIGTWAREDHLKTVGWLLRKNVFWGVPGLSMKIFTERLHMSETEAEALFAEYRSIIMANRPPKCFRVYVIYGQKPCQNS